MTGTRRKRGRPIGGKAPPEVRAYWREIQRNFRASRKIAETVTGKRGENKCP